MLMKHLTRLAVYLLLILKYTHLQFTSLRKLKSARKDALRQFCKENDFPCDSIDRLAAQSHYYYKKHCLFYLRLLACGMLNDFDGYKRLMNNIEIHGSEHLKARNDSGVVVIGFHVGPFPAIGFAMMMLKHPLSVLVRSDEIGLKSGKTIKVINEQLEKFCRRHDLGTVTLIDSQTMLALVQIKKAHDKKNAVLVYPDTVANSSSSHIPSPFFKQTIAGHAGVTSLLRVTQSKVIFIDSYWDNNKITINIEKPVQPDLTMTDEELTKMIYSRFEEKIRTRPAQWIQAESYNEMKLNRSGTK